MAEDVGALSSQLSPLESLGQPGLVSLLIVVVLVRSGISKF